MLNTTTKINIAGESIIDEKVVCTFTAQIDPNEPEKMVVGSFQRDKEAYKEHRTECREDFAAFEDAAYMMQAEYIKAKAKK